MKLKDSSLEMTELLVNNHLLQFDVSLKSNKFSSEEAPATVRSMVFKLNYLRPND